MSTTLLQSRWLDKVARRIEQACSDPFHKGLLPIQEDCPSCHGSGRVRPYAESGTAGWLRDRPCPECKGKGFAPTGAVGCQPITPTDAPCQSCCGSGKKDSEWPVLVWTGGGKARFSFSLAWWRTEYDVQPHLEWYHALEYTDAFTLLKEAGWCITIAYTPSLPTFCAAIHVSGKPAFRTQTVSELLDKIQEAMTL